MIQGNSNKQSRKSFFLVVCLILATGTFWYLSRSDHETSESASSSTQKNILLKGAKEADDTQEKRLANSASNPFISESVDTPASKLSSKKIVSKITKPDDTLNSTTDNDVQQEGNFENEIPQNLNSISSGVEKLTLLLNTGETENSLDLDEVKQNLLDIAKQDVSALGNLINAYEDNIYNQPVKDELLDVLSTIKDPEVEQLGIKLVKSGDQKKIIDGLSLLDQLSIPSEETLELTLQIISQSQIEPDILLPAIHAMPLIPIPEEKRSTILSQLSNLSQHKSEAVRSESIFAISRWAKDERQLAPVIQALQSDAVDDKISAIMALEESPVVSINLKEILLAKMTDDNELWEIRSISADALKRFNLTGSEYSEYKDFREKQINDE